MIKILKFIAFSLLMILAGMIGSKGFMMPNSAAADMCFGGAALFAFLGFWLLAI